MNPSERSTEPTAVPNACAACGRPPEDGRRTPLCVSCRSQLAARPFPRWIKAAGVLLVGPFLFAAAHFPAALSAFVAFERGERAEAAGAFGVAVVEYTKVVQQFPNSTLALARKGISAFHAGQ